MTVRNLTPHEREQKILDALQVSALCLQRLLAVSDQQRTDVVTALGAVRRLIALHEKETEKTPS